MNISKKRRVFKESVRKVFNLTLKRAEMRIHHILELQEEARVKLGRAQFSNRTLSSNILNTQIHLPNKTLSAAISIVHHPSIKHQKVQLEVYQQ